ncbi:hypothetical protein GYH30_031636 [Glycine max]|nr:hypothetical protein GYH30_031636 [Glycine max]
MSTTSVVPVNQQQFGTGKTSMIALVVKVLQRIGVDLRSPGP